MKKKILLPLGLSLMAVPAAVCFVACGSESQPSNNVSYVYLNDGVNEQTYMTYEYKYGERLDFFENLKIVVAYEDGTRADLEESEYENVTITYKKNGEPFELDSIGTNTVLDCGWYQMEITYAGKTATLSFSIGEVATTDMNYRVFVREQGSDLLPSTSTFRYGTTKIKNEEVETEEGIFNRQWIESPYEVIVVKNGKYVKTKDITGVYLMSSSELEDYSALETFEEKQEFLEGITNIHYEEDGYTYYEPRSILYNSTDIVSDSAYVLEANWIKPGTYYAFAKIDDDNHLPIYTEPQSRVVIQKGIYSFKESLWDSEGIATPDEMINALQLHADFTFSAYYGDTTLNSVALKDIEIKTADNEDIPDNYNSDLRGGGRGMLGWGHFEFKNKNIRVNSTNDGQTFPAVFVLDYDTDYYDVDQNEVYDVVLNIKGSNVFLYTDEYDTEYVGYDEDKGESIYNYVVKEELDYKYQFGEEITPDIKGYKPELFEVVGGQISAINIGSYYVDLKLKDTVNYHLTDISEYDPSYVYVFQGFTHADDETIPEGVYRFKYNIVKATRPQLDEDTYSFTVNGEKVEDWHANLKVGDKIKFELIDEFYTQRSTNKILWSVSIPEYVHTDYSAASISDDKLSCEFTITAITASATENYESIRIRVDFEEDNRFAEYYVWDSLLVCREWSEELKSAVYGINGDVPATLNSEDGKYYTDRETIIALKEYYCEGLNLPESEFGDWYLSADSTYNDDLVTFSNFKYTFVPNDKSYYEFDIYANNISYRYKPEYELPTNLTATYGQRLADVQLPEGFTWQGDTSQEVGYVGEHEYYVVYTPANLDQYYVVKDIKVILTVGKADPAYEVPTGLTAKYGQTLADIELPVYFYWQDDSSTSVGEVGERTFLVSYVPFDSETYNTITDIEVTIQVSAE